MNINSYTSPNFQAGKYALKTTRFNLPSKTGKTMNFEVIGDFNTKITSIKYFSGKMEKTFQNKRGFQEERLGKIFEDIEKNLKEGMDFLYEFLKAQRNQNLK